MNKEFIRHQGTKCDFLNHTGKVAGVFFLVFYSVYVGTACRGLMKYVRPLLFSQGGNISTAPTYSNDLIFTSTKAWPGRMRANRKLVANSLPSDCSEITCFYLRFTPPH
jgi:hypothetical protein